MAHGMTKFFRRLALGLLSLLALYTLLGSLVLPGTALQLINQQLALYATQPAKLQRLEFNPFTLELDLYDFSLGNTDHKVLEVARLHTRLAWDTLWSGRLHIQDIRLEKPSIQVTRNAQGQLNLNQWFKLPVTEDTDEDSENTLLAFLIDRIQLQRGQVHFRDAVPKPGVQLGYQDINLQISQLASDLPATLSFQAQATNHLLKWQGQLNLFPQISSQGQLSLEQLNLTQIWPYVQAQQPLKLDSGTFSLQADYQLQLGDSLNLELKKAGLQLQNLQLYDVERQLGVQLKKLQLSDVSLQANTETLSLHQADLALQELTLNSPKNTTLLQLQQLAINDTQLQADYGNQLQLLLKKTTLQLLGLALNGPDQLPLLRLQQLDVENPSLNLAKSQLHLGHISSQGLEAWANRAQDGQLNWLQLLQLPLLQAEATATPSKPEETQAQSAWHIQLPSVALQNYRLHLVDRVPDTPTRVEVGPLSLQLKNLDTQGDNPFQLALETTLNKKGKLALEGELQLKSGQANLKLTTQDIDLRLAQPYLSPFVRLELNDGRLATNLRVRLRKLEPLDFRVQGALAVQQLHTQDSQQNQDILKWRQLRLEGLDYQHNQKLSVGQILLKRPYLRLTINPDFSTNLSHLMVEQQQTAATSPQKNAATSDNELALHIGGIRIEDGSSSFTDLSLKPHFATRIESIQGQIGTIDNRASQRPASINLQGKVNSFSPVKIKGSLTPFDPLQSLDLSSEFRRLELTAVSPYSGKFAGFRIRKGRLDLELNYQIQGGQLKAQNKVVIDQLELGEKVDSPEALDLPIRLGISLLKDSAGRISLELPIKGDLNNPQFSVMPLITQTLGNLISKAVQSPFKAIGGLVDGLGNKEQINTLAFAPGTTQLKTSSLTRLYKISQALKLRPNLTLEVEGGAAASLDGPLLAQQRLNAAYQQSWYRILKLRGQPLPDSPEQLRITDTQKDRLVGGIYRYQLKQKPTSGLSRQSMEQELLEHFSQSGTLLRTLGQQRGINIKQILVEHGLSDQRIYLLEPRVVQKAENAQITQLNLGIQ